MVPTVDGEIVPSAAELVKTANTYHLKAEEDVRSAMENAWNSGRILLRAKAQVKHGDWLALLKAYFEGSPRKAQRYMALATKYDTRVAFDPSESIRGALAAICQRRPDPKPTPDVPQPAPTPEPGPEQQTGLPEPEIISDQDAAPVEQAIKAIEAEHHASELAADTDDGVEKQLTVDALRRIAHRGRDTITHYDSDLIALLQDVMSALCDMWDTAAHAAQFGYDIKSGS